MINNYRVCLSNIFVSITFSMDISLFRAVAKGDCKEVQELIRSDSQILKMVTPLGNTALHVAASRKDRELVKVLLSSKTCIILMRNGKQETALHKAVAAGCLEVVKLLLNPENEVRCNSSECAHPQGCDLEGGRLDLDDLWKAQNVDDETALHYAARGDYVEIVRLLLEKVKGIESLSNKSGESALYTACQVGSWGALRVLGEIDYISDTSQDGQTCLHQLLTIDGYINGVVFYLLEKRLSLAEQADAADNVPLHLASTRGNLKIVKELVRISPHMALRKNKDEMAAIHIAARMGYTAIVRLLIKVVPHCIEVLGKDNKNALHFALEYGKTRTAKILLSQSMDSSFLINHADIDGHTPFHQAAASYRLAFETLSPMLRRSRWNVNAVDKNGHSAMDVVEDKIIKMPVALYRLKLRQHGGHRRAWTKFLLKRSKPVLEESQKMDSESNTPAKVGSENKKESGDLSVVATLIFTVSFAAALTVPGGLRSDNGIPLRMHATALRCFILSDALAFCFSILAMFMLTVKNNKRRQNSLCIAFGRYSFCVYSLTYQRGFLAIGFLQIWIAFNGLNFLVLAVSATMIAFITGVYVVVAPTCFWLAITVCTMVSAVALLLHSIYSAIPGLVSRF